MAGCGSGKTYMMLTYLAKKLLQENMSLVLAVPTTAIAAQAEKYDPKPVILTADNKTNRFEFAYPYMYAAVYDKVVLPEGEITKDMAFWLSNCVLVIDEAHDPETAWTYRSSAIAHLNAFVKTVIEYGGTVIRMTGTPRKLGGLAFDDVVRNIFRLPTTFTPFLEAPRQIRRPCCTETGFSLTLRDLKRKGRAFSL